MEKFVEGITEQIKTTFKVTKIPVGTLKEFKKFCKEECGDIYSVGIFRLLQIREEYKEFMNLLSEIQSQVNELKAQLNTRPKGRKTFGD